MRHNLEDYLVGVAVGLVAALLWTLAYLGL